MPCRDCLNGTHVRSEVNVDVFDTVTLRHHVCVCGACPQACPARPMTVEPSHRWHGQHRAGDGAVQAASAAVWTARAAAARAAAVRDRAARAARRRPGRHRASELGRATGPAPGGQGVGELATCGAGDQSRHGVGVIRRSTPVTSSPARYDLDQFRLCHFPVPAGNH